MARFFGYGIVAMLCNVLWLHFVTLSPSSNSTERQIAHLEAKLVAVMLHLDEAAQLQQKESSEQNLLTSQTQTLSTENRDDEPNSNITDNTQQEQKDQQIQHSAPIDTISALKLSPQRRNISLSACLLIKDDNDLLNEWLAYHTHAVNLKYLVVAVDPSSSTSPTPILNRWRNLTSLQIVEWNDPDFMPPEFIKYGYHIHPDKLISDPKRSQWHEGHEDPEKVKQDLLIITNHRYRQVTFLSQCLNHMRQQGKSLVMHIDTDEFVVLNRLLRGKVNSTADDPVIQTLVDYAVQASAQSPNVVFDVLQYIVGHSTMRKKVGYPCVSMPRLLYGSKEMEDSDNSTLASTGAYNNMFNATRLETLRWRYHTDFQDMDRNAQPKVIVDVSQVPSNDRMFSDPFSIHRPSMDLCKPMGKLKFREVGRFPVTVNHYLGSWERYYFSKNDTRRSERAYQFKANVSAGRDDWLESWLDGFVATHGPETSRLLLQEYAF